MHHRMKTPKYFLLIIGFVFLCSSFPLQAEEAVYSVNVVGFQKLDLPDANLLRMSSTPFETGSNTLIEIFGTNMLKKGTSPLSCDRIRFWDVVSQTYVSVAQAIDNNFYLLDGLSWDSSFQVMNDKVVHVGDGFWIATGGGSEEGREIMFVGDVIASPTNEIPIIPGYQLITVPFSSEMPIQDAAFVDSGATSATSPMGADRIRVWNAELQVYEGYALAPDNQWYLLDGLSWDPSFTVSTHVFQPGEAFFYWGQSAFTWVEDNPYLELFTSE